MESIMSLFVCKRLSIFEMLFWSAPLAFAIGFPFISVICAVFFQHNIEIVKIQNTTWRKYAVNIFDGIGNFILKLIYGVEIFIVNLSTKEIEIFRGL